MWVIGLSLLLVFTSAAFAYWATSRRSSPPPPLWDIPTIARSSTDISGVLSALSLAAAVFIATLAPDSPEFETSIGLFIFSFLILVASAMQFSATPNLEHPLDEKGVTDQYLSYVAANCSFYLGTALSWLGLRLLMISIGVPLLAEILTWVLLLSIVVGALRISMHLYRHGGIHGASCIALPVVALAAALAYRYGLGGLWSDLWPNQDEPLWLAVLGGGVAALGYLSQTVVLAFHGNDDWEPLIQRFGRTWLAVYAQGVVTVVSLVWLAVAEA
jgi:hypothetical protein